MNATKSRNRLIASDWYDINFIEGFLNADAESKRTLNEKRFIISNEMLPARTLNHWQQVGLIRDDRPDGKGWRKFSMSEVIWIRIIMKLRKFGMNLESIRRVRDYLEIYSSTGNQSKFPELDYYILYAMKFNKPAKMIVFDDGQALMGRQIDIDMAKQIQTICDDFISIDINNLVNEGFKEKSYTDYINHSTSNVALEVERSLFDNDIQSITITTKKNSEFLLEKEVIKATKKEIEMLLNRLEYADVKTQKRGNKTVYFLKEMKKIKR